MHDLRFALRTLRKNPGFALVAILSLALGTGANVAIFSLIDTVLLRMLPVAHPEQLVFVNTNAVKMGSVQVMENIRIASLDYLARHATTIVGIAGEGAGPKIGVGVDGQVDRAAAQFVSPDFFSTLGIVPSLGRTLNAADNHPDGRVAVISYAYWQRRFGGDATVIGRNITLNGIPFTIVGVTPRDYYGLAIDNPVDVVVGTAVAPQINSGKMSSQPPPPDESAGMVIARLKRGVSAQQAAAELTPLLHQSLTELGDNEPSRFQAISNLTLHLVPAGQGLQFVRSRFSEPLRVLMAVVAIVLLIACANLANLLLAKSASRRREIAIRMSLGSTRGRLIRQLLTESLLLAAAGGSVGLLFAIWARDLIVKAAGVPGAALTWDYRVIAFTAGLCVLSALLFGTMPAIRATAGDFASALKSSTLGRTGRFTLGRALVAAQVAMSLALLMGASLFLYTFRNLDQIDLGYARKDVLIVTVDPKLAGFSGTRSAEIYRQALDRLAQLPGVRSVSLMGDRLMSGNITLSSVFVPGYTPKNGEDPKHMWVIDTAAGPNFLATSGIRLLAGRDFDSRDTEHSPKVALINETMAHHFWGDQNPVGRQFSGEPGGPPLEVVGVVRDVKYFGVREGKQDVMFTPSSQQSEAPGHATVMIRTAVDPTRVAAAVRSVFRTIDRALPVYDLITMDEQVEKSLSLQRLVALLSAFFGGLALMLAVIGLYGVLSYSVAQRSGEIGIRMALGARPASVLRMVLGETARLVLAGLAAGVALALTGGYLVRSMLYGVTPTDATSLIAASLILTLAALVAAFLPARRAASVDPMVALRHE